jgi:hypothetical protein
MSAERAQHLREFATDGPDKVRENISLNRYDRRTLARAVLGLEQHDKSIVIGIFGQRESGRTVPVSRPARWSWLAAAMATIAAIAAAALLVARFAG